MKKLIFAVAVACGCAQFAHAEQNKNWFTGYAEGTEAKATNGAWPQTMPEGVTVAAGKFTLELDYESELEFTPVQAKAPDTNVMTRVLAVAKFESGSVALPTSLPDGTKTALAVSGGKYYAYANGAWVEMTGTPSAEAVKLLAEIDYKYVPAARARFATVDDTTTPWTTNYLGTASDPSTTWLTLANTSDPALISTVSFSGDGEVTSVRGDVQLGVASYDSVKYPTVQEAVDAAGETQGAKVTVLRDNDENVVIANGQDIALDTNGKECGVVANNSGNPVVVEITAADVAKGNGTYTNATYVVGDIAVETTDKSKEVSYEQIVNVGVVSTVITREDIIDTLQVADKTLTVKPELREYLQKNSSVYSGPSSTTDGIQAQLNATGENGMTVGQSYALGLQPTDDIVLQPAGADADPDNVKLAMPNVKPNSDFTVKYQVMEYKDSAWSAKGDPATNPNNVTIPVGSGRFRVDTIIAPAN